jgi:hypothetical protein
MVSRPIASKIDHFKLAAKTICCSESEPFREHQNQQDDYEDPDKANPTVTEAVAITPESPTEAAQEKNNQDDQQNET